MTEHQVQATSIASAESLIRESLHFLFDPPLQSVLQCPVPVRLTILGSGSSGNCAYLETDEVRILIDAGFTLRQIRQRLATIGRAPENLTGVLVTHEHNDHVEGLSGLAKKLKIPVYCNRPTQDALERQLQSKFI